jgi:trk system potassium uptake protein TrkH
MFNQLLLKIKNLTHYTLLFFAFIFTIDIFFGVLNFSELIWKFFITLSIILLIMNDLSIIILEKLSLNNLFAKLPDVLIIILFIVFPKSFRAIELYILGRQTLLFIRDIALTGKNKSLFNKLAENPPGFLIFSFLITIFAGTILLLFPGAATKGTTTVLDALFTATSATCVTGLIVQDTGLHFSQFGQIIILLLIQVGGLGIMTISSAFAVMLGQKMTVKSENLIQNVVGESNRVDMAKLVRSVVSVTFAIEILGALAIYFSLSNSHWSMQKTLYYSVFHSVSAFCNAGFSLYSDNLVSFMPDFNINLAITSLIIIGGIGFPVMMDIQNNFRTKFKFQRLSLHTKIVLTTTFFLVVFGAIAFFASEYNYTMQGWNLKNRILASYFHSVTTRTAGFNTIDTGNMSLATMFISMILMFIGASPGSTGGGIKTTTFFVLMFSVFSLIKGNKDVNIFHRKVSEDTIKKVMAMIALSLLLLSAMIFLLLMIEPFPFEQTIFEAVSAYGTVGLSTGITGQLSDGGKMIIILLMYIGRVGPLTMVLAFSQTNMKTTFQFVEEKITIG